MKKIPCIKSNIIVRLCTMAIFVCLSVLISGCTIKNYSSSDAKRQEKAARPILENYFSQVAGNYEIETLEMVEARIEGYPMYAASYESDYVYCAAKTDKKRILAYVNTATGEIWSNLYSDILCAGMKSQLEPICMEHGIYSAVTVSDAEFYFKKTFKNSEGGTLEVDIWNCLPSTITPGSTKAEVTELTGDLILTGFDFSYEAKRDDIIIPEIFDEYYKEYYPYSYENVQAKGSAISEKNICKCTLFCMGTGPDYSKLFWKYENTNGDPSGEYVVFSAD